MRGNFSTNYQLTGRELMTADEVRLLDNRYAILFIRGERPIIDLKYDILKHPNVAYGVDGGGEKYEHGYSMTEDLGVGIEIVNINDYPGKTMKDFKEIHEVIPNLEAFDEESLDLYLDYQKKEMEKKQNEKQNDQKQSADAG